MWYFSYTVQGTLTKVHSYVQAILTTVNVRAQGFSNKIV